MRVFAIQNYHYTQIGAAKPNRTNQVHHYTNNIVEFPQSNISFYAVKNAEPLRELIQYGIPDMYTGKMTIPPGLFENLLKSGVFNAPARYSVKFLKIFEDTFSAIPYKVFQQIKKYAHYHPDDNLQEILQGLSVENEKTLRQSQKGIFSELNVLADKLPKKTKTDYEALMQKTNAQLAGEPITTAFSKTRFIYDLKKIHDDIKDFTNPRTASIVSKMVSEAEKLLDPDARDNKERQKEIINNINETAQAHHYLKNYKPLDTLLTSSFAKLDKEAVIIPFSRKVFIWELDSILSDVKNARLKEQMHSVAEKLPTSKEEVGAYILKYKDSTPDKIAYRLAHLSYSSIEHRHPKSKGGKNSMKNYAVASVEENSSRGNIDYTEQMKRRPNTAKNNQKQIDRLIQLANRGKFRKHKISTKYIRDYKQYTAQESKGEILLDISKLKEDK